MATKYIFGVDGGGSKCRVTLFDLNGEALGSQTSGSANVFTDFEQACTSILSAAKVLAKENDIALNECSLSAACAGASIESAQQNFAAWQHPFAKAYLLTDVEAACIGANEFKDCALVVIGTGSCLATLKMQKSTSYGGHGFLLGDIASGAWLGKSLVSWYLQALDGVYQDDSLFASLSTKLGKACNNIIDQYAKASPKRFAELAMIAFEQAPFSPTASALLDEGALYILKLLYAHCETETDMFLDGGLAALYQPYLEKASAKHRPISFKKARFSPQFGAFLHAKKCLEDKG